MEADLLLTDPPYNVAIKGNVEKKLDPGQKIPLKGKQIKTIANDDMEDAAFYEFLLTFYTEVQKALKPGASFYIWHASTTQNPFINVAAAAGLEIRQVLIWVKNTIILGRQDYQWKHEPCLYGWKAGAPHYFVDSRKLATVFEDRIRYQDLTKQELVELVKDLQDGTISTTIIHEDKPLVSEEHPTMKPIKLMARLIANSSREGEIVLDPFGGSGSTLLACEQLRRTCYTIELDPQYCDVILQRWENATGSTAELMEE